jgi:YkoY family integral membrane protein
MSLPILFADVSLGFWGQTFGTPDLVVIAMLVLLEGVLSIDNALVLGLLAKRVPKHLQQQALTYGLIGAFVFRVISIASVSYLLKWRIVKLLGGGYLVYIAVKHLFFESKEESEQTVGVDSQGEPELRDSTTGAALTDAQEMVEIQERVPVPIPEEDLRAGKSFWMAVAVIELTDIAFAVDSILAAMAFIPAVPKDMPPDSTNPKLWVVVAGGFIGLMLMRVAAVMFIKLLERFPRFETSAYLLVIVIGLKLLADWGLNSETNPHVVDFHSYTRPEFWIFWISMALCLAFGFLPKKSEAAVSTKSNT